VKLTVETFEPKPDPHIVRGVVTFPTETPAEHVLLGNGWLRRGDAATLISSAGAGKSTGITQAAICWSLGLPYFGIAPARPLRVLLFSGEDDAVTIGQCREGLIDHAKEITGRNITRSELETLSAMLRTDFSREHVGKAFHQRLDALLTAEPADLVLINPLLSYIGGEIVSEVSEWFRVGLLPLLQKHEVGAIVASHTNRMARDSWENTDDVYSGIGGGEMANIPRAVLTLRPTKSEGLWVLRVGKRVTTGWTDTAGQFSTSYHVRRSGDPQRPAWLPVDEDEAAELLDGQEASKPRHKADVGDVVEIVRTGAVALPVVLEKLQAKCGLTTAKTTVKRAEELELVSSFNEPNPNGGKARKFLCLPEHLTQWSK
jgi:hypothetical protein